MEETIWSSMVNSPVSVLVGAFTVTRGVGGLQARPSGNYQRDTRNYHGDAYRHEMTDEEHEELARGLFGCKGFIIVSGYDCDLYQDLYGRWERKEIPSKSSGGWRTESLWLSPQTMEAINQKSRQALLPLQGELHA